VPKVCRKNVMATEIAGFSCLSFLNPIVNIMM
jgi:hypothetical protein